MNKDEHLVTLSRYIHLNPVRAKIVQKPEEYRWTSYSAYIDRGIKSSLVDSADTLSYFSNRTVKAAKRYRKFVETEMIEEESPFKDVEAVIVLGGDGFKAKILGFLDKKKDDVELPQIKRLRGEVGIDKIITSCCSFYGKKQQELLKRGKGKRERQVVIYLSKVLSGKKNTEVGRYFGIKGSAVSEVIKVVERCMKEEKLFRREVDKLKGRIIEI